MKERCIYPRVCRGKIKGWLVRVKRNAFMGKVFNFKDYNSEKECFEAALHYRNLMWKYPKKHKNDIMEIGGLVLEMSSTPVWKSVVILDDYGNVAHQQKVCSLLRGYQEAYNMVRDYRLKYCNFDIPIMPPPKPSIVVEYYKNLNSKSLYDDDEDEIVAHTSYFNDDEYDSFGLIPKTYNAANLTNPYSNNTEEKMKTEHSPICDKELPKDVHSKVVDEDDEDDDGDYSGFFDDDDEDKIPSKSEPNIGCRPQYEDDDDDEIILRRKPKPRKKTATVKKPPRFRPVSEEPISGSLVIASLKSDKFVPCLCKKTPNVGLEFFVVFESEGELKKYDTITDVVAWAYSL